MFNVKLEVFENYLDSSKETFKANYAKGKQELLEFVEKFKGQHEKQQEETQWEHFQVEMSEAFQHFKQAFSKS